MNDLFQLFKMLNALCEGKFEYNIEVKYRYDKELHKVYMSFYVSKWQLPTKKSDRAMCVYKTRGNYFTITEYLLTEMTSLSKD